MTIILSKQNKAQSIALIQQVIERFLFPGCTPAQAGLIMQHVEWIKRQTADMNVTCQLSTDPPTASTSINLTLSFSTPIGQVKN